MEGTKARGSDIHGVIGSASMVTSGDRLDLMRKKTRRGGSGDVGMAAGVVGNRWRRASKRRRRVTSRRQATTKLWRRN